MENNNLGHELDFDGVITKDTSFELLPEGEYDFIVTKIERGKTNGTDKMPPCNKVDITLEVDQDGRSVPVKHSLLLHSRFEGQIAEFFVAIGLKKKNESLRMNWNAAIGARGKCKLGIRTYNGNEYNQVKKFIEPTQFVPGRF